jgi:hypothetical protein
LVVRHSGRATTSSEESRKGRRPRRKKIVNSGITTLSWSDPLTEPSKSGGP